MKTRSGLTFSDIHPDWFICAYCYEAALNCTKFGGMVRKRVRIQVDGDYYTLPEFTEIWTDPHCYRCHRRVLGLPLRGHYPRRHTY